LNVFKLDFFDANTEEITGARMCISKSSNRIPILYNYTIIIGINRVNGYKGKPHFVQLEKNLSIT